MFLLVILDLLLPLVYMGHMCMGAANSATTIISLNWAAVVLMVIYNTRMLLRKAKPSANNCST